MRELPVADAREVRRATFHLIVLHPCEFATAIVMYAAAVTFGLVSPYLLGRLVEQVSDGRDQILVLTTGMLGALVLQAVLLWAATRRTTALAEQVAAELRERFFKELLNSPLARIESVPVGDLVARSTRDVTAVVQVASQAIPSVIITLLTSVATLVAMLLLGWYFLACLVVALPILVPTAGWYLRRSRTAYLAEQASYSDATQVLTETLRGARTIADHGLQEWRLEQMHNAATKTYQAERYTLRLRSVFLPLTDTTIALPAVAVLFVGGLIYFDGYTSIAAITTATLYAQQLSIQVDVLLYQQDKLQVGSAALARLLGIATMYGGGRGEDAPTLPAPRPPQRLSLRGVSFAYSPGNKVLHGIDLDVPPGQRVAIVGPSGAGKSTLARLVVGIDTPDAGSVELNDVPLVAIDREQLAHELVMVTQHSFVFAGSIRDNLLIAAPEAGDERLVSVLEAVGAEAMLEQFGLATPISEVGRDLSPSEQQQLSLARLIVADPGTIVLDEATSQFDSRFARGIERSLASLLEGRTVISIAHRLHSAEDAERVLVMQKGRIVEDGSHEELLALGGVYAELWAAWHGQPPGHVRIAAS